MDTQLAQQLMERFCDSTGVTLQVAPRRYLWTDAFAVCTCLGLYRTTGHTEWLQRALTLAAQVHGVLGRHRPDDPRSGWISGLADDEGARHPTRGGLRIGKQFNERTANQPADPRREWDQDGQYFHYLTKWMHALCRLSRESRQDEYLEWAAELAVVAHRAFTYEQVPGGPKRMYWKMSIDLTRPLVTSMGHHDPLDGLVTTLEVRSHRELLGIDSSELSPALSDFVQMCRRGRWASNDPLGIGGLLDDAFRLAELVFRRDAPYRELLVRLLVDARSSLQAFPVAKLLDRGSESRLAFRELGLSIGLHALPLLATRAECDDQVASLVYDLRPYGSLAHAIEEFWIQPSHQTSDGWIAHEQINMVMLATSLAPEGYLAL